MNLRFNGENGFQLPQQLLMSVWVVFCTETSSGNDPLCWVSVFRRFRFRDSHAKLCYEKSVYMYLPHFDTWSNYASLRWHQLVWQRPTSSHHLAMFRWTTFHFSIWRDSINLSIAIYLALLLHLYCCIFFSSITCAWILY